MIPIFATTKAMAIVASGADKAFPSFVRRSKLNPKVERSMTIDKTYTSSRCSRDKKSRDPPPLLLLTMEDNISLGVGENACSNVSDILRGEEDCCVLEKRGCARRILILLLVAGNDRPAILNPAIVRCLEVNANEVFIKGTKHAIIDKVIFMMMYLCQFMCEKRTVVKVTSEE